MGHFAKVDNGIVTQVIVAEQDVINTGMFGDPNSWIQTSYNTFAGKHTSGGTPLRKNYAGIGYIYDLERDAFYVQQPYPSWILNEDTCVWESPVPMPDMVEGFSYTWDEATVSWISIPIPQPSEEPTLPAE